jgi:hypothetical protein
VHVFSNPEQLSHWQKGLIEINPIRGNYGEEGYEGHLKFEMGKRVMEMTERVEKSDLPHMQSNVYETKGVFNRVVTRFESISEEQTKCITEHEFVFSSFGMKVFALLMPGAFKKQSMKYLEDFKALVEQQYLEQKG